MATVQAQYSTGTVQHSTGTVQYSTGLLTVHDERHALLDAAHRVVRPAGVDSTVYSTVQYSTVQYSTVQYSTVQYLQKPECVGEMCLPESQAALCRKQWLS